MGRISEQNLSEPDWETETGNSITTSIFPVQFRTWFHTALLINFSYGYVINEGEYV
jgi:hypothetical protein